MGKADESKVYLIPGKLLNELLPMKRQWQNLEVKGGSIKKSNQNAMLKVDGGNGVPEGYEETEITLCMNGSPVIGTFLFKEEEEEE